MRAIKSQEAGGAEKVHEHAIEAAAAVAIDGCTDLVEAGGTCYACWTGGEGLVRDVGHRAFIMPSANGR